MRLRLLLLFAVVTACSGERATLRADIPVEDGDRALIVAVLRPEGSPEVRAYAIAGGVIDPAWTLELGDAAELEVHALAYRRTLEELELSPGALEPAGDGPSRALPVPDRILIQALADDALGTWSTADSLDARLEQLRLPLSCPRFSASLVPLPGDVPATFLVAVNDRLLLGNLDGELYEAHADGRFDPLASPGLFWDAYAENDGALHLAGPAGRLVRARLSNAGAASLEILEDVAVGARDLLFVAGDPAPGGTLRFAASSTELHAHEAGAWRVGFASDRPRGLSWIGAGRVRGIFGYEFFLRGLEAGVEAEDEVHVSSIAGGMTAVGWAPSIGAVAGTEYGQIYQRRGQSDWTLLETIEPVLVQIRGFAAYAGGFVYARPDALIAVDGTVACPFGAPISAVGDLERPEIGVAVEDAITNGGRAEITVVGRDVAALAWVGTTERRPRLVWFRRER